MRSKISDRGMGPDPAMSNDIDTRIRAAKSAVDEARTVAVDIQDEVVCDPLTDARRYLNWALSAFERAEVDLEWGSAQ